MAKAAPTPISPHKALYKLQTWFSPSYPIGAYSYSHGLESAFHGGLINNGDDGIEWIGDIIRFGNGFGDAVFMQHSYAAAKSGNISQLIDICQLAIAYCGTAELRLESHSQGKAFIDILQKVEPSQILKSLQELWLGPYPYCVVAGAICGECEIDVRLALNAYLHGVLANLSSALVRLIPLGQTDGQRIIVALEETVEQAVERALETSIENLTTSTPMVEITSMRHETQYSRLFRS